jgi:hypothetical protein
MTAKTNNRRKIPEQNLPLKKRKIIDLKPSMKPQESLPLKKRAVFITLEPKQLQEAFQALEQAGTAVKQARIILAQAIEQAPEKLKEALRLASTQAFLFATNAIGTESVQEIAVKALAMVKALAPTSTQLEQAQLEKVFTKVVEAGLAVAQSKIKVAQVKEQETVPKELEAAFRLATQQAFSSLDLSMRTTQS